MHRSPEKIETEVFVIPAALSCGSLRLVQISDLHGVKREGLTDAILALEPDGIMITGDLFDGVQPADAAFDLVKKLRDADLDLFYVTGNHEWYRRDIPALLRQLEAMGVTVLEDREVLWKGILVAGISQASDPAAIRFSDDGRFRLVLIHDPMNIRKLAPGSAHLVLAGHEHGGQFRIGRIGLAGSARKPGRRFKAFPRYTSGLYRANGMCLIVSRGLGDNMKVPRIFNPWHLPVIELRPPKATDK